MNLHSIVAPYVAAVNPQVYIGVRSSIGTAPTSASGSRTPRYATPGALVASIADTVLTVTAVSQGVLQPFQTLAGSGLAPETMITRQLTGKLGGIGTYQVSRSQTLASRAMTTSTLILAQVQPLSNRDLQQIEGLNLGGDKKAVYVNGNVDGVVRVWLKGGDLVDLPDGSVWLVNQSLESFDLTAGWTKFLITLQDGA